MEKGYEPPDQPQGVPCGRRIRKCTSKNIIGNTPLTGLFSIHTLSFLAPYANFLKSDKARILGVFVLFLVYLWPSIIGIQKIPNRLDYRKFLPNESKLSRGFDLVENNVWNDYLQEVFIINKAPDFTNKQEYKEFRVRKRKFRPLLNWKIAFLDPKFAFMALNSNFIIYNRYSAPKIEFSKFSDSIINFLGPHFRYRVHKRNFPELKHDVALRLLYFSLRVQIRRL